MKKSYSLFLLTLLYIQLSYTQTIHSVTDSTDRFQVLTNRFGSNIFFGAGVGSQMFFGDHDKQMKFLDRQSFAYEFYLGKWFTPGIGVRAGINAGKLNGLTQTPGAHSTGEAYDRIPWEGYWLERSELKFYHVKGDVMFNLFHLFNGYKEHRFYELSPYVGLGYMVGYERPKQREVSANIGLYNAFNVHKNFSLTLDVRGAMVHDRFDSEEGNRREDGLLTAMVGIRYNLPKQVWEKPKHTTTIYDNSKDIEALKDAVEMAQSENKKLLALLKESEGKTVTKVIVDEQKEVLAAPLLVTFEIDKWEVSNESRVNLEFLASVIKKGSASATYAISGYADKATGSERRNKMLSKNRAEAIFKVLVEEFGVNAGQLSIDYKGGVDNMFYDDPRLSRAVIILNN